MDNDELDYDISAFKLMQAGRKSVLLSNIALSQCLGQGIFCQYETFNENGEILIIGIRPNSTAVIATELNEKIMWSEIFLLKEEDVTIIQKIYIREFESPDHSEDYWLELVDQIEDWVECKREIIDLDYR